jgi:endonuclease/exonuclease/phosphatase family metal-dependent hydrolase
MFRLFRKITSGFVLGANILVILFFLLSCITPYLHPGKWWFTGFTGLLFPYLLGTLLLFLVFWLIAHPRKSLYTVIALILGFNSIRTLIAFRGSTAFPREKTAGTVRVMNWNVRYFVPFRKDKFQGDEKDNMQAILHEISAYQPDIICFQEFYNNGEENGRNMIQAMTSEMGYPYHYFSRDQVHWKTIISGTAVFSRYPIIRSMRVPFPENIEEGAESTVFCDLQIGNDTVRVGTFHLQSFRFMPRDYQGLGMIKNQQDKRLEESKKILRKMRNTFYLHGEQSDFVRRQLDKSPYPLILCGDLNDVPNSYAYLTIRGDLQDAFLEKGSGIGKTFTSASSRFLGKLPTLRIDYTFADPGMRINGFHLVRKSLSDHFAMLTDLTLAKKE